MDDEGKRPMAEVKAVLAQQGQTVHPEATLTYIKRPEEGTPGTVIILDRVQDGVLPEYCTHGYATCIRCDHYCWIGHASSEVILSGEAFPLCTECAPEVIPPDSRTPIRQVQDHLRKDGPHE